VLLKLVLHASVMSGPPQKGSTDNCTSKNQWEDEQHRAGDLDWGRRGATGKRPSSESKVAKPERMPDDFGP
jgi:hypothetical protein